MPFVELDTLKTKEPVPGYQGRFVHMDNMTLAYWEIEAGCDMPEHSHPHEQVVNLIEGEFELTLGGESKRMQPGEIATIPPEIPHAGRSITRCRIIDVYHPVREDLR